jgi:hypothetical protein
MVDQWRDTVDNRKYSERSDLRVNNPPKEEVDV